MRYYTCNNDTKEGHTTQIRIPEGCTSSTADAEQHTASCRQDAGLHPERHARTCIAAYSLTSIMILLASKAFVLIDLTVP